MIRIPQRSVNRASFLAATVIAVLLLLPNAVANARADEIPHENYDLVGSNLDVVIALLNSSIAYSELALDSMYDKAMNNVQQNLSIAGSILTPAGLILDKIKDVAGSYEDLSRLLPPFESLSTEENSFATMETSLIDSVDDLVSASTLVSLTGDDLTRALDAVSKVYSLIIQMNMTIDRMLDSATNIIALDADGRMPFTDNNLIPKIERLRELLNITLSEVDRLVNEEIPWSITEPFLLLWLASTSYYLEDVIRGGGALFFDGAFAANHEIEIVMDANNLTQTTTLANGRYSFSYPIPLNSSWLGTHTIQAAAMTPSGLLSSASVLIDIVLIPTEINLEPSETLLTIDDQLRLDAHLQDKEERPVPNALCYIVAGAVNFSFTTNAVGDHTSYWNASELGYGVHAFQAFYVGALPYAPSSSDIVTVTIDIPTNVTLNLFAKRFFISQYVLGNGTLVANGTTPIPGERVTISVDGIVVANSTTDLEGVFAFAFLASSFEKGTHILKAAFIDREIVWRYSEAEAPFSIYTQRLVNYPFFPVIPGWGGGGIPETIPYIFFGEYAYITWLLILALMGTGIRILQARRRTRTTEGIAAQEVVSFLDEQKTPAPAAAEGIREATTDIFADASHIVSPNERIIRYYRNLLGFLRGKRNIGLRDSMTHWEVASLLKSLGYPFPHVDRATLLFEQALYSGSTLTDTETVQMSAALGHLINVKASEAFHAI
jgi:hypothetical protein